MSSEIGHDSYGPDSVWMKTKQSIEWNQDSVSSIDSKSTYLWLLLPFIVGGFFRIIKLALPLRGQCQCTGSCHLRRNCECFDFYRDRKELICVFTCCNADTFSSSISANCVTEWSRLPPLSRCVDPQPDDDRKLVRRVVMPDVPAEESALPLTMRLLLCAPLPASAPFNSLRIDSTNVLLIFCAIISKHVETLAFPKLFPSRWPWQRL